MSYCRFGRYSDVYVIHHVDGFIQCCGCFRGPKVFLMGANVYSPHKMDDLFSRAFSKQPIPFKKRLHRNKRYQAKRLTRFNTQMSAADKRRNRLSRNYAAEMWEDTRDGKPIKQVGYLQVGSVNKYKRSEMIDHLRMHREMGDKVPDYAIERLQAEIEKLGDDV